MGESDVPSSNRDTALAMWGKKTCPRRVAAQRHNFVRDSIFDAKDTMPRRQCPNILIRVLANCGEPVVVNAALDFVESTVLISHQITADPEPNNAVVVLEQGFDRRSWSPFPPAHHLPTPFYNPTASPHPTPP